MDFPWDYQRETHASAMGDPWTAIINSWHNKWQTQGKALKPMSDP